MSTNILVTLLVMVMMMVKIYLIMSFGQVEETAEQQTDFDQIIMFSDRITFDAQNNDFTVSAFRNINLGAGRNVTITNKGFTVIESENIYISKEAKNKVSTYGIG